MFWLSHVKLGYAQSGHIKSSHIKSGQSWQIAYQMAVFVCDPRGKNLKNLKLRIFGHMLIWVWKILFREPKYAIFLESARQDL